MHATALKSPQPSVYVRQVPVLSTGHVSYPCSIWLLDKARRGVGDVCDTGEGFFINTQGVLELSGAANFPELKKVVKWVEKHHPNSRWFSLDGAGGTVSELQEFGG